MGYDLHFEDGRHEWHNIWTIETMVLMIAYAEGRIKKQELLDKITIMAMSKSAAEGSSTEEEKDASGDKKKYEHDKSGKPRVDYLVELMSFDKEEMRDLPDVVFSNTKMTKVDKIYGARIIPKDKESAKKMAEIKEEVAESIMPFIAWRERLDSHRELLKMKQFDALFQNDGEILTSTACAQILLGIMKIDKKLLKELDEYSPMGAVGRLLGHLGYSAGSGYSITIR